MLACAVQGLHKQCSPCGLSLTIILASKKQTSYHSCDLPSHRPSHFLVACSVQDLHKQCRAGKLLLQVDECVNMAQGFKDR